MYCALVVPALCYGWMFGRRNFVRFCFCNLAHGNGNMSGDSALFGYVHDHFAWSSSFIFYHAILFSSAFSVTRFTRKEIYDCWGRLTEFLIARNIWKRIFRKNPDLPAHAWLPIFIFVISPVPLGLHHKWLKSPCLICARFNNALISGAGARSEKSVEYFFSSALV